jgi:hypothetical protein
MYQVLGVTSGITSIGGVRKIKDGVTLPFSEYIYADSTEGATHHQNPILEMCNDSQFVFTDSVTSHNHGVTYDRQTYTLVSNDIIKDSVETLGSNGYELSGLYLYKIISSSNDTSVILTDGVYNQEVCRYHKGISEKTIDVYSPYGTLLGRQYIIYFTK